jgi:hypothetical protein
MSHVRVRNNRTRVTHGRKKGRGESPREEEKNRRTAVPIHGQMGMW